MRVSEMNEGCLSLLVSLFFSLFCMQKGEKKRERKEELKKSSREKEAPQKSVHKRGAFVCKYENMKELMNSNFLHSFKEAVT